MFAKCLKYELKAGSRTLVPLLASVLVVSILIAITFGVINAISISDSPESGMEEVLPDFSETENGGLEEEETLTQSEILARVLSGIVSLLEAVFGILVYASFISVFVLMVRRFYTSFFTDEGYLTFTLPVTVDCHIMTKTVSSIIWSLVCGAVVLVATVIVSIGASYGYVQEAPPQVDPAMAEFFKEFVGTIICAVVAVIVADISSYFLLFFSISVGCMLTKKHRFLACAGCVFVISNVLSIVMTVAVSIITIPFMGMAGSASVTNVMLMAVLLVITVLSAALGAACYFGTRWILTKKINLD